MKINVKRLNPEAKLPSYAHPGDAGADCFCYEKITLAPGERKSIPLGFALELPEGYVSLLWDKSSLSHRHGLKSFGGVIDAGYRGEYFAGIMNLSDKPYTFEKGDKIIQLLVMPVVAGEIVEVDELSDSSRGTGGFGSTGK
jgi:dUTP pyrophosphatase